MYSLAMAQRHTEALTLPSVFNSRSATLCIYSEFLALPYNASKFLALPSNGLHFIQFVRTFKCALLSVQLALSSRRGRMVSVLWWIRLLQPLATVQDIEEHNYQHYPRH